MIWQIRFRMQPFLRRFVFRQKKVTVKVLSYMMVDLTNWVDVDPEEVGVAEMVYYPALSAILEQNEDIEDIKDAIRRNISRADSNAHYKGRYFCFH